MVNASDFRKGVTFEKDGQPCLIVDFQHVKPGKGAAFVRTKYKNLKTGAIREEAFNPSDKFPKALIETKQMQYLYDDGELYYFMDEETYDQIPLNYEQVEDAIKFLKENEVGIVGVTKDDIIAEAKTFDSIPVDMVEWRVDWFENVFEFDKVELTVSIILN